MEFCNLHFVRTSFLVDFVFLLFYFVIVHVSFQLSFYTSTREATFLRVRGTLRFLLISIFMNSALVLPQKGQDGLDPSNQDGCRRILQVRVVVQGKPSQARELSHFCKHTFCLSLFLLPRSYTTCILIQQGDVVITVHQNKHP